MAIAKPITLETLHQIHRSSGYPDGISAADRIWTKIDNAGPDDCWEWQGKRTAAGYGQVKVKTGPRQYELFIVHRLVYILTHGEIPVDQMACHTCDNPPCCNPAHLFADTGEGNQQDMIAKGRKPAWHIPLANRATAARNGKYTKPEATPRGEKHRNAKLTDDAVRVILGDTAATNRELAERFGVTRTRIAQIRRGIGWSHLRV